MFSVIFAGCNILISNWQLSYEIDYAFDALLNLFLYNRNIFMIETNDRHVLFIDFDIYFLTTFKTQCYICKHIKYIDVHRTKRIYLWCDTAGFDNKSISHGAILRASDIKVIWSLTYLHVTDLHATYFQHEYSLGQGKFISKLKY